MLEESIPELDLFVGKPGDLVPVVAPTDLKALWTYADETRRQHPAGAVATGIEVLKHICSPGADARAISYRCGALSLLAGMLEAAWPGGQPSESAFKVAARIELKWLPVGVVQKGLPFDVESFLAEVHGESMYGGPVSS